MMNRIEKAHRFGLLEDFLICLQVFLSSAESGSPDFKSTNAMIVVAKRPEETLYCDLQ